MWSGLVDATMNNGGRDNMEKSHHGKLLAGCLFAWMILLLPFPAGSQTTFTEVSQQTGIRQVTPSWGAAWIDWNNDGWEDLYTTNHHYFIKYQNVEVPPALFQNNGGVIFSDVTVPAGLVAEGDWHGAVWGDYNNDGLQDLFQSGGGGGGQGYIGTANRLYKNQGTGTFVDIAVSAGVDQQHARGRGGFWVDYNTDGLLDLFILNERRTGYPSVLMKNNGNDTFSQSSLSVYGAFMGSAVDVNNDNRMDLFLAGKAGLLLYLNNGDGTFSDGTAVSGLSGNDYPQSFAWGDYDNDGDMDLFVTRAWVRDALEWDNAGIDFKTVVSGGTEKGIDFLTTGSTVTFDIYDYLWTVNPLKVYIGALGGHPPAIPFTLQAAAPDVQGKPNYTPGIETASYVWADPAGWHFRSTTLSSKSYDDFGGMVRSDGALYSVSPFNLELSSVTYINRLYENLGNGTFVEVGTPAGVADISNSTSSSISSVWADFDNDGWLDLYVVNTGGVHNAPNKLYMNNGNKTFTETAVISGVEANVAGRGDVAVVGDYDNNGFPDLFVTNGSGPAPFSFGPHLLYQNNGNANHWLKLKLTGHLSNRDAVGAVVTASVGGMTTLRQQTGGVTRAAQNSQILHFGLGTATLVDLLTVTWPSGVVQTLQNVPADQMLTLTEPTVQIAMLPKGTVVAPGGKLSYTVRLTNDTNVPMTVDYWAHVTLAGGAKYPKLGELTGPTPMTVPAYSSVTKMINHVIPLGTAAGTYTYWGYAGKYSSIWSENNFVFTVQ
ncbi:MAG: CRTAC1 family protein [Nitrospirae bacterium]|nr:CRTAC1 family protein [Nitrospirota bacterium]